jgi:hypothetical protein
MAEKDIEAIIDAAMEAEREEEISGRTFYLMRRAIIIALTKEAGAETPASLG